MKRSIICLAAVLVLTLVLVACGAPGQGPMTWLDRPLDGSKHPLGPITILAHSSDADGVASFEFFIDQDPLLNVSAAGARLGEATVEWTPTEPGIYTVGARATDSAGNTGSEATSVITVGEMTEAFPTLPPEPSEEGEIVFFVEPDVIPPGACAVLHWEVHPPAEALLDGEGVPAIGEREVCPEATTTYELLAPERNQERTVTLHVEAPPEELAIIFVVDPDGIRQGQCAVLRWEVAGPEEWGTLLDGSEVPHFGEREVCPPRTTSYELLVEAPDGPQVRTVTLHVEAAEEPTIPPEPTAQPPAEPTATLPPAAPIPTPTTPPPPPTPTQPPPPPSGIDLAITDLYADGLYGSVWARITNHGPGTVNNQTIHISCQWNESISGRPLGSGQMPPMPLPIGSLSPGQTQEFNTDISVRLGDDHEYDMTCTIQVPFTDPNMGNNSHSETLTKQNPGGT